MKEYGLKAGVKLGARLSEAPASHLVHTQNRTTSSTMASGGPELGPAGPGPALSLLQQDTPLPPVLHWAFHGNGS